MIRRQRTLGAEPRPTPAPPTLRRPRTAKHARRHDARRTKTGCLSSMVQCPRSGRALSDRCPRYLIVAFRLPLGGGEAGHEDGFTTRAFPRSTRTFAIVGGRGTMSSFRRRSVPAGPANGGTSSRMRSTTSLATWGFDGGAAGVGGAPVERDVGGGATGIVSAWEAVFRASARESVRWCKRACSVRVSPRTSALAPPTTWLASKLILRSRNW